MATRTQKEKDFILSTVEEPYFIENFLNKSEIVELISSYKQSDNKVHKVTGPITSDIEDHDTPALRKIYKKIKELYPKSKFMCGNYFYVEHPHIIHNDDKISLPSTYKAFTFPLEYDGDEVPYMCFFDQFYLDGPSKFFKGEANMPTHYNELVYDYENVIGKTNEPFEGYLKEKYLTHLKDEWLKGLSLNSSHYWQPGNAIVFDCCRLHCASDFRKQNIKSKLGLSLFFQQ